MQNNVKEAQELLAQAEDLGNRRQRCIERATQLLKLEAGSADDLVIETETITIESSDIDLSSRAEKALKVLLNGPKRTMTISKQVFRSADPFRSRTTYLLRNLKEDGLVYRLRHGVWGATPKAEKLLTVGSQSGKLLTQ